MTWLAWALIVLADLALALLVGAYFALSSTRVVQVWPYVAMAICAGVVFRS